ncbi:TIGR03773 family transporter-associated surface protein [Brevibacterium mcbrellneri]|uniref:TIGR03773 family transporter-associated surface protein n=1 Tax=Brevibacterium mcbrellneri TaxID=53363 RepID=UPI00058BAFDA|nr:TIGR03773 family transporter-associated surface protein [Brevibacterium mcbrellneri]
MPFLGRAVAGFATSVALIASVLGTGAHAAPTDNTYTASSAPVCGADATGLRGDVPKIGKRNVVATEHADAVAMCIRGGKMHMFSKVDWAPSNGKYEHAREPANELLFHVSDALKQEIPAKGFEFTHAAGKRAWMIPQNQNHEGLWAGWNTQDIAEKDVKGGKVTMRLNQKKSQAPKGAHVEVFQTGWSGSNRIFSLTDPKHSSYEQIANAHVHANWVFTHPGVYRLVFDSSAVVNGKRVTGEQEYVFVVGDLNKAELEDLDKPKPAPQPTPEIPKPAPTSGPTTAPSAPATDKPAPSPSGKPGQPAPEQPSVTVEARADKDQYEAGDTAVLSATIDGGDENGLVSWERKASGSENWEPVEAAQGKELRIENLEATDSGTVFRAVYAGETRSNEVELKVGAGEPEAPEAPQEPEPSTSEAPSDEDNSEYDFTLTTTLDQDEYVEGQDARAEATYSQTSDNGGQPLKVAGKLVWETRASESEKWMEYKDGKKAVSSRQIIIPSVTKEFDGVQFRAVHTSGDERVESKPVTLTVNSKDDADGNGGSANAGQSGGTSANHNSAPAQAPVVCEPTAASGAAGQGTESNTGAGQGSNGSTGGGGGQQAPAGQRVRVTDGHFDFGARLNGKRATAQVKDDRTSPPVWRNPSDVMFVLGDASKKKVPAEFGFLGKPGSDIYMIGQTQESQVPWLGWNTQDEQLVNNATKVTMRLDSLNGPGKLNVFVGGGGLGGGSIKHVFRNAGDSYDIPLRTHEHGNWVFSAPGNYTATVTFTVKLKDGSTTQATGTLNFEVGQSANAGAGNITPTGQTAPDQKADAQSGDQQGDQSTSDQATADANGGDSTASVSNADAGNMENCAHPSLPRTGVSGISAGLIGGGVLIGIGIVAVVSQRRRRS